MRQYIKSAVGQLLVYLAGLLVMDNVILDGMDIYTAVLVCKWISLIFLIVIGADIWVTARNINKILKFFSGVIILWALVVVVLMFNVIFGKPTFEHAQPVARQTLEWMLRNIGWCALGPIFMYAPVNLMSYLLVKNHEVRETAKTFFLSVDLPCVVPMIIVILISAWFKYEHDREYELFISGAIAMLIFSSNLLTKRVETFELR